LVLTFLVLPFWYLLTRVVPDKFQKSSKTIVCVCVCCSVFVYVMNGLLVLAMRLAEKSISYMTYFGM